MMPTFWELQYRRLLFRGLLMQRAITMGLFWCFALAGAAWLDVLGLSLLSWGLVVLWLYLALPALALQFATFADIAIFVLTGKAYLLRTLDRMERHRSFDELDAALRAQGRFSYAYLRFRVWLGETSPLAPLATWGLLVLFRLPHTAHTHEPTPILKLPEQVRETAMRLASARMVATR